TYTRLFVGSGAAEPNGIAVDSAGDAVIAGTVSSTASTGTDIFITKFNPTGTGLLYTQVLRGSKDDTGTGVALDAAGNAYVTGTTFSVDFPTTSGVVQPAFGGGPVFRSSDVGSNWTISS